MSWKVANTKTFFAEKYIIALQRVPKESRYCIQVFVWARPMSCRPGKVTTHCPDFGPLWVMRYLDPMC